MSLKNSGKRLIEKMAKKKRNPRCYYDYTLDLHGYILEDAILELEHVMYSGQYDSILVVHGIGQGILKNGVRRFLSANSFVKRFFPGEDLNLPGGDGVTLVEV